MGLQYPLRWESTGEQWWFATPVDWAAANGHFEVVRELLKLDGNLLMKLTSLRRIRRLETVWDDDTSFSDAAKGRGLVARRLLHECDTKQGNTLIDAGYGGWLLYTSAAAGDIELVRDLLKREPLLVFGEGEYGDTDMLYAAARSKSLDIFKEILDLANDLKGFGDNEELGASMGPPSTTLEMMNRAVHAAARGGSVEVLKELLKRCPDAVSYKDNRGSTALHSAASRGRVEVVAELLLICPDIIYFTNDQGNTPLHVAAHSGHLSVVKALLAFCPSLFATTNNDGNTILHLAVTGFRASGFRRLDKQIDLVRYLISEKPFDLRSIVNCKNVEGQTALHMAVTGKVIHGKLVELLLSAPEIDINVCDKYGMTVVDILELDLLSGIRSESLRKQLALAGGRPMRPRHFTGGTAGISQGKTQAVDNSPGTSFRAADTYAIMHTNFEDASGSIKIFEELSDEPCRRLSVYTNVDCNSHANFRNSTSNCYSGYQKKVGSVNQAKRLATLLGWSYGQNTSQKEEQNDAICNRDMENSSKLSAGEVAVVQTVHPREWLLHRSVEIPSPLRRQFSKASMSESRSDSFVRKALPNSSTKKRFTKLFARDVDHEMSSVISPFASPLRSFSQSPPSLGRKLKGFIQSNEPVPVLNKPSIKEGGRDNAPVDCNPKPLPSAMNQYFCFGIRGLPNENQKSKHPPGVV